MEKRKIQKVIDMLNPIKEDEDTLNSIDHELNQDEILSEKDLIFYEDTNPNTFENNNHLNIENI